MGANKIHIAIYIALRYIKNMLKIKTKWFNKWAGKNKITDRVLQKEMDLSLIKGELEKQFYCKFKLFSE